MPMTVVSNPLASGPQPLCSGNPWSGKIVNPSLIQLQAWTNNSGLVYFGYSGGASGNLGNATGITLNSGGMFLSGGGLMDGFPLAPGAGYAVPARAFWYASGFINVWLRHDAACSGQSRIYWMIE